MAANLTVQQFVAGTTRQLTTSAHRPEKSRSKAATKSAPPANGGDPAVAARLAFSANEPLQASAHHPSHPFGGSAPASRPTFRQGQRWCATVVETSPVDVGQDTLAAGRLVEFKKDTRSSLGLILHPDGKRNWMVLDARGQKHSVRPQTIACMLPGMGHTEQDLAACDAHAASLADESLLSDAWQMLEQGEEMGIAAMSDLLFGAESPAHCYAAHRLLSDNRVFFKQLHRRPPVFVPRQESEVQHLLHEQETEAKAAEHARRLAAAVASAREQPRASKPDQKAWLEGPFATELKILVEMALGRPLPNSQQSLAAHTLQTLGLDGSAGATVQLLRSIGFWSAHEQPALLAAGISADFPAAIEAAAEDVLANPCPDADANVRQDLTHMTVLAIDDASTVEVDDGVSAEVLADGQVKIWAHIADPSRWIGPDSPLAAEAKQRTSTMYLATGSIPMFPSSLANACFSLGAGQGPSPALSIWAILDSNGALADFGMTSSVVHSTRMTYNQVDEALLKRDAATAHPTLHLLQQGAQRREEWRVANRAYSSQTPGCRIKVRNAQSDEPEISASPDTSQDTPGHQLVSEIMIMANQIAAHTGHKLGLPLPYRGLGLPAYVQVTSPIRRYGDLIAHWQFKAALRGQGAPLSPEQVEIDTHTNAMLFRERKNVARAVDNYWLAELFRRQQLQDPGRKYPATMLTWIRQEFGLASVMIIEMGLETVVKLDVAATAGQALDVCCISVDMGAGEFRLTAGLAAKC
ncbi:hypothetical protein WJX84_010904 [Apatococcus fuscideae]|uniref:RNB domain-containing protein n=1 Tax=Apatococcus fuscideae TaxID=2026836 RepID=A0AAW1STZ2_9CHLO